METALHLPARGVGAGQDAHVIVSRPATEWVENVDVERENLGAAGREVLRPGGRVQRLRRFDVALLKGEAWPGNAGNGAVHRSPAVLAGQCRIMLSIDAVD